MSHILQLWITKGCRRNVAFIWTRLTQAVVERIMAQSQRRYPQAPTISTSHTSKSLKDSQVEPFPDVRLPTGPMPEEPWYDPDEDEAVVPLIGEAVHCLR